MWRSFATLNVVIDLRSNRPHGSPQRVSVTKKRGVGWSNRKTVASARRVLLDDSEGPCRRPEDLRYGRIQVDAGDDVAPIALVLVRQRSAVVD